MSEVGARRVQRAGQAVVLHDADQVHFGQRGVPRALQADLGILDLQAGLAQVGAVGQGFGEQILDGPDLFLLRDVQQDRWG